MKKFILSFCFVAIGTVSTFAASIADCTITVKDNQSGKSYTITVHGTSCADLIKQMIK